MSRLPRRITTLAFAFVLVTACTSDEQRPDAETEAANGTSSDAASETEAEEQASDEPVSCRHDGLDPGPLVDLTGDDGSEVAGQVAAVTHTCAPVVVLAPSDDPWAASLAVPIARATDGPLLLSGSADDAGLTSTLSALDTEEVVTVGSVGSVASASSLTRTELIAPPEQNVGAGEGEAEEGEVPEEDQGADEGEGEAGGESPDVGEAGAAGEVEVEVEGEDEDEGEGAPSAELRRLALAIRVAEHLDTERFLAVDAEDEDLRGAALARLEPDVALLPLPLADLAMVAERLPPGARVEVLAATGPDAERLAAELAESGIDAHGVSFDGSPWPAAGTSTWLVDPADGAMTAVGAVAAAGRGESLLPIDGTDPRSDRERTMRIRDAGSERHVLLGTVGEDAAWQLETVLEGEPFPWGGFRLFEDERMVALYGSAETKLLGALGEQGLDATVARLRTVAEPYGADGARVLPAFELITTIASGSPEPTGDYSRRAPIGLLREWVARAAEEELYVVLDLQPGRTDFLTQAKEYEELLLEPHVGLALDPEWRLEPDQRHLRQIGSVEAAEVQEVVDWLATLTREHRLPEKLLVLHQFRFSMLPDRDDIVIPPELAGVVHMDGQGPLGTKYDTYAAITAGVEDRWLWGWKNFYDEDIPTPTPEQVLALDPLPVFVSYQ